jgi:hypothetical protein
VVPSFLLHLLVSALEDSVADGRQLLQQDRDADWDEEDRKDPPVLRLCVRGVFVGGGYWTS